MSQPNTRAHANAAAQSQQAANMNSQTRYQSVPNPNGGYDAGRSSAVAHAGSQPAGRRSTGDVSGSGSGGSGSAESASGRSSTAPMLRGAPPTGAAYADFRDGADIDSRYAHIRKGSMGRMGARGAQGGAMYAGGAGSGATLGSELHSGGSSSGPRGNRASAYSAISAVSSGPTDSNKYYEPAAQEGLLWDGKGEAEPDDYLHNPDSKRRDTFTVCSGRGILNVLALFVIVAGLLALFAGYPIISHYAKRPESTLNGFNIGGTNGSGQVPVVLSQLRLRDNDTPASANTWRSPTGETYNLVFSDEFNQPGRTFWPGDDPFWEAMDIWYGATGDYEWLSPEQVNTTGGHLLITMENRPTHNLNFRSGQLQSWNKFCFQGGYIEFSAILPGSGAAQGWWPGLWTMGNLGRPGYLGTTDGMWPYSYQGCDNGILPNQSSAANGPTSVRQATKYGRTGLNWLSGMRSSSCTCSGEDHPGPSNSYGRAAPEIDILEAQTVNGDGEASQSLQVAPFDMDYEWGQTLATVYDRTATKFNSYTGGVYQEAVSAVSAIPADAYELNANPRFVTFGLEYHPDWDADGSGDITWYIDGKRTWTVKSNSVPARPNIGISQRIIPTEPMSIIMNLHISEGFQHIEFDTLQFPATLKVDYVRVYQLPGQEKVGCDPSDHPTKDYIERHHDVYYNPNLTTWPKEFPKNRMTGC